MRFLSQLEKIQYPKAKIAFALLFAVPWCWLFAGPILTNRSFAYRDAAHHYFPLWRSVARSWYGNFGRNGTWEMPLWNPGDNCGQPLAADATSCAFYPGTWLFASPLPYPLAFKLIIALHFVGAAFTMTFAARNLGRSWSAAALSGLSYAFGGYVIAQHSNPVFLIGATWLPLAMYCGWQLFERCRWHDVLGLAAALALMVLGGDPQTAYHAVLAIAICLLLRAGRWRTHSTKQQTSLVGLTQRAGLLLGTLVAAVALSAVQIVSSSELVVQSQRSMFEQPRSIWEWMTDGNAATKSSTQPANADSLQLYDFSVPPFRIAELLWPNVSGKNYAVYSRWTKAMLGEGRTWNPSLYFGLLPLVLALAACRWRMDVMRRWLMIVAALALVSSLGHYGVGALCNGIAWLMGGDPHVPEAIGGLYWLEVKLLPNYALFRYPAKWLVIFAWAMSLLSAFGWDELLAGNQKWPRRLLFISLAATATVMLVLPLLKSQWLNLVSRAAPDKVFGPLQTQVAWHSIWQSLLQHVSVGFVLLVCFHPKLLNKRVVSHLLLLITAIDLMIAHQWQLSTVDDNLLVGRSLGWTVVKDRGMLVEDPIYMLRSTKRPAEWSERSSINRPAEIVTWERATLFAKYHLNHFNPRLVPVRSVTSMMLRERVVLLEELSTANRERQKQVWRIIDPNYLIIASQSMTERRAYSLPGNVHFVSRNRSAPRAWVAFNYQTGPAPPTTRRRSAWQHWVRDTLDSTKDVVQSPVLHQDSPNSDAVAEAPGVLADEIVSANCVDRSPNSVLVSVKLDREGLLVLRDSYYPGWRAYIQSDQQRQWQADVRRVNAVQRGLLLPAGDHQIVIKYQPIHLQTAAVLTAISWLIWLGLILLWTGSFRRLRVVFLAPH